jgi:hypothetical protein
MLIRFLTTLCLQVLGAPACGWVVRRVIVLSSREASPRRGRAAGGAGAMVPVR